MPHVLVLPPSSALVRGVYEGDVSLCVTWYEVRQHQHLDLGRGGDPPTSSVTV